MMRIDHEPSERPHGTYGKRVRPCDKQKYEDSTAAVEKC